MLKNVIKFFSKLHFWNTLSFRLPNNFLPNININDIANDVDSIKKEIEEIDLNLKSNYNSMLIDVLEFKQQIDTYLNILKDCERKITFILRTYNSNESILRTVYQLEDNVINNKKTIELLLRMYDLKSKTNLKKV